MHVLRSNGQEHWIGIADGEIPWFGFQDNLLLVEQCRWVLLHNPFVLSLELRPDVAQNGDCESLVASRAASGATP